MFVMETLYISERPYAIVNHDSTYELCEQGADYEMIPVFRNKSYENVKLYAGVMETEELYGSCGDEQGYYIGNGRWQNELVNELKGAAT